MSEDFIEGDPYTHNVGWKKTPVKLLQRSSKMDYRVDILEDQIIYRGRRFTYQVMESIPEEGIQSINILVDGSSHTFNMLGKDFPYNFMNFASKFPARGRISQLEEEQTAELAMA
jgi:hypothetical protein